MEHLKYPIGRFSFDANHNSQDLTEWKQTIKNFPLKLEDVINGWSEEQLNQTYRPEGWSAKQVIHHVSDSHCHAMIRFKWTLTEDQPTIKPYLEEKYAQLSDYKMDVNISIQMLKAVHEKWINIMDNMSELEWSKGYVHPSNNKYFVLKEAAAMYAWHCMHHLGHIELCSQ